MSMSTLKVMAIALSFTIATGSEAAINCGQEFTSQQMKTMATAYGIGKSSDLGYTLAAISWQESKAGQDVVSMRAGQVKSSNMGAFQNRVESVGKREGCKNQRCYANTALKLITSQKYAANAALDELNFWLENYNNNLRKSLSSYNAGYARTSKSNKYAASVTKKTSYLQRCVSFNGLGVSDGIDPSVIEANRKTINRLKRIR